MGEHPDDSGAAAAALTRLFVAADRLGIDVAPLKARVGNVIPAFARDARASLDSDNRLAIRGAQTDAGPGLVIPRPATARWFELEQGADGHVAEIVRAEGRRAYAEDRALLLDAGVPAPVTDQVGELIAMIGDGSCDGLAHRRDAAGETWIAAVAYGAMNVTDALEVRELTKARLVALARAIDVHAAQVALLEELHGFAHHGFSVGFQFGARGIEPVLLVEYANISWSAVTGLAQRLRPVPAQAPRLGTFAGAFDAPLAAALQLAFGPANGPNRVARVRVSVDAP